MIDAAILFVLTKYDATIYRVSKLIDEIFFSLLKTSTGTINPALKRLMALGCVECTERMSEGGMLSKTFSITTTGKKHLTDLLCSFESTNPYHIINEAKIALYCSSVLSINELTEFKENLLNNLELHKIKLERGLKNDYINLDELQKRIAQLTIKEIEELIKLL